MIALRMEREREKEKVEFLASCHFLTRVWPTLFLFYPSYYIDDHKWRAHFLSFLSSFGHFNHQSRIKKNISFSFSHLREMPNGLTESFCKWIDILTGLYIYIYIYEWI